MMFQVANRRVPEVRGGNDIWIGRTLLVGCVFAGMASADATFFGLLVVFFGSSMSLSEQEALRLELDAICGYWESAGVESVSNSGSHDLRQSKRDRDLTDLRSKVQPTGHPEEFHDCTLTISRARQARCSLGVLGAGMLTHRGFSAWIVVDGKPLPEYLVAVDSNANRVSCWIPSEEGKHFAVHWQDHGGKVDTCAFITLDGFVVPGRFLFGEGVASRQGVRTSPTTERPFVFRKVDETASETSSECSSQGIGVVALRIKQVARVDLRPANPILELPRTVLGKRKAGDFCVGFGEENRSDQQFPSTWSVVPHDKTVPGAKQPSTYVTFVFRYRSREFLVTQGIATEPEPVRVPPPRRAPPPRKKAKIAMIPPLGPYPRPTQDMRRAVSCKVEPNKNAGFPGQGLLVFDGATIDGPWGDSGDSSPEAGFSQSSGTD
ncbi:hypothetical protein LshimejAT787_0203940 [Lyophyllum shimeji]|uniref:DUF7918 domain-containing protein n=1 Tax=Lyophyllum shimeji TaxID=47721 RepID=A0A9P3PG51_LYOSH|nr:hypothetical protein LshimejAT787_0203940 [Lyophyllum shimeji]